MSAIRYRALAGALLAGASALALSAATPVFADPPQVTAAPSTSWVGGPQLADLVEQVAPAVVQIVVHRPEESPMAGFGGQDIPEPFRFFFGPDGVPNGAPNGAPNQKAPQAPEMIASGSGFLIDRTGVIVTNNHVVDQARSVTVTLSDGREFDGRVLGVDEKTDLAVVKIDGDNLPAPVVWGDSGAARVGDPIFAMGAPFGLGGTVTAGIISARGRDLRSGPYDDFLQVDAPINRGNSGGPLFNASGQVIGVNSQIYSPDGGNVGIGFAIPSDLAQDVVQQIVDHGSVERGWLGVSIQPVTPDIASSLGLNDAKGALVAEVNDGSPAKSAGVEVGDVIVRFGDEDIGNVHDLTRAVADAHDGDRVRMGVFRDGRERNLRVAIGRMPGEPEQVVKTAALSSDQSPSGVDLDRLGLRPDTDQNGVVVAEVTQDGPAAEAGLQPGDHITRVNQSDVSNANQAREAVAAVLAQDRSAVLLQVERGGEKRFVGVPFSSSS